MVGGKATSKRVRKTLLLCFALLCIIIVILDFHWLKTASTTGPGGTTDQILFARNLSLTSYNNNNNNNTDNQTVTVKSKINPASDRKKTDIPMLELVARSGPPERSLCFQRWPISNTTEYNDTTTQLPQIRIMIPTVRRIGDPNYLGQVLAAMETRQFPLSNVFVFDLTNSAGDRPREQKEQPVLHHQHVRFGDARLKFPHARYVTVTAEDIEDTSPPPPPGYFNNGSQHFPLNVQKTLNNARWGKEHCEEASIDDPDRKRWRRKECYDFLFISRYVLSTSIDRQSNVSANHRHIVPGTYGNVTLPDQPRNKTTKDWIILNQDDGIWRFCKRGSVHYLVNQILMARGEIVKLHRGGAVSLAFQEEHLRNIVNLGQEWCNWLPLDWMISFYAKNNNVRFVDAPDRRLVSHTGKVSTKDGRVGQLKMGPETIEEGSWQRTERRRGNSRPIFTPPSIERQVDRLDQS